MITPMGKHCARLSWGLAILVVLVASGCGMATGPDGSTTQPADGGQGAVVRRSVLVEQRELAYVDVGSGPAALVFVHGWAGDSRVWDEQIPALSDVTRLIAVDLPGHGASQEPADGDYSLTAQARALAAVLDHAAIERAVLVGHSNGAPSARLLALAEPDRVRGLIVLDGALRLMIEDRPLMDQLLERFSGPDGTDRTLAMTRATLGNERDPAQLKDLLAMVEAVPENVRLATMEAAWDPAAYPSAQVTTPTLMVMVAQPAWTGEYRAWAEQLVPDLDWQLVRGVTHYLQLDMPTDLNRRIATFVVQRGLLD